MQLLSIFWRGGHLLVKKQEVNFNENKEAYSFSYVIS